MSESESLSPCGRLAASAVSDTTVARLYRDAGLERG